MFYSITSSARASSVGGMVRSSALAVLRLIVNRKRVGCSNGSCSGFAPLRMRSISLPHGLPFRPYPDRTTSSHHRERGFQTRKWLAGDVLLRTRRLVDG